MGIFMVPTIAPGSTTATTGIHSLDAARQRRYIDLANAHWEWQQTKASWALEGLHADDDSAECAGRMIAGEVTYEQIVEELRRLHRAD